MVYLFRNCPLSKSNLENSASLLTTPCSIQIQHSHFRGRHYQVKKLRPKIRTLRLKPFEEKSQKLHEGANKLTLSWEALKAAKYFAFWWVHLTFDDFAVWHVLFPLKILPHLNNPPIFVGRWCLEILPDRPYLSSRCSREVESDLRVCISVNMSAAVINTLANNAMNQE